MLCHLHIVHPEIYSSFAQYIYGVYLGLSGKSRLAFCLFTTQVSLALPFLIRAEVLLSPLLPLFASYIVSLLGFNISSHVLQAYFSS